MNIGNIQFGERPLFLAPMEDVTDIGFRHLCKRFGASMVYTEFVSAEALVRSVNATLRKLTISDEERPVGIQIYGRDVESMVEAAKIVEQVKPDVIDINFGCPVKKVAGKGAGAGMLQNIPLLLDITREVVKAVNTPVTVKTRLGWNHDQLVICDLAEALQDCGIQALTIHGRTRAQMYTGDADWTLIGEVNRNSPDGLPTRRSPLTARLICRLSSCTSTWSASTSIAAYCTRAATSLRRRCSRAYPTSDRRASPCYAPRRWRS